MIALRLISSNFYQGIGLEDEEEEGEGEAYISYSHVYAILFMLFPPHSFHSILCIGNNVWKLASLIQKFARPITWDFLGNT